MTARVLAGFLWVVGALGVLASDGVPLAQGVKVVFMTQEEGMAFLGRADEFVKALSPIDRSARLRVARAVGQGEYLKHVRKQVRNWSPDENAKLVDCIEDLRGRLKGFSLPWPETIGLVKTTGAEEGGAAYTRGHVIVFPVSRLKQSKEKLRRLLLHELFHVLSRANPQLADRLYGVIGYSKAAPLKFPRQLAARKLTNPDAPFNRHIIEVMHEGKPVTVAPILYSRLAKYDEEKGGPFFRYLVFRLLVLNPRDYSEAAQDKAGRLTLLEPEQAKGFHEKIGRNTKYIIHPEETMADNFVYMVTDRKGLPNPEIVKKMRLILLGKKK